MKWCNSIPHLKNNFVYYEAHGQTIVFLGQISLFSHEFTILPFNPIQTKVNVGYEILFMLSTFIFHKKCNSCVTKRKYRK